ncbi:type II toxin-antitoxin system VapC family toxin [uncultured Thiodictyon sp.]|jgi:ribonuclease VapC|uniref:type II toxin-antitoxin system VapC family toxin n=1 Tax=uncultured Thiodictyon sp. TaxID=1846217 RepID=UPI0025DE0288|nr:type II toxin-antitoxin system VapC family toxin [uncultured Thiodictyon sp.]
MVIDPSALLAVLQDEPERRAFNELIEAATRRRLSTASLVELSIVIEARQGAEGIRDLDLFLATAAIELVPFDAVQARLAREGFRRFGKGRHPAGLNLGDCFSYALARVLNEPLLFKGDDFPRTDVTAAYVAD